VSSEERVESAVRWRARAFGPTAGLFALVVGITIFAGPITAFTRATAEQLLTPNEYILAVLGGEK
jgi:multicomponent K+:H+ antiporter subunit D